MVSRNESAQNEKEDDGMFDDGESDAAEDEQGIVFQQVLCTLFSFFHAEFELGTEWRFEGTHS